MNWLCWLIDHKWHPTGAQLHRIVCERCQVEPYDDTTLPEWFRNTRIVPRVKRFARRVRLWIKSRKCWKPGHDWSPTSQYCRRCGMSGVEDAERGEWMLPEWKKLWRVWLSDRFYIVKPYLARPQDQDIYAVQAFNWRFGVERSTIYIAGAQYMTRYIAYLGPIGLRLHQFFRGDDDRASHTHPWPFITFPFTTYVERIFKEGVEQGPRKVKAWRFHYRPHDFEHIVVGTVRDWEIGEYAKSRYHFRSDTFWTFVITGPKTEDWGFYPKPGKFVYWREYK